MTTYLVQQDIEGNPLGVWAEDGTNFYPQTTPLKVSAQRLVVKNRLLPWEEHAERLAERISHRDWWQIHKSDATSIEAVWQEISPSDVPLVD